MLCCQRPLSRREARAVSRIQSSARGCPCAVTLAGDWEKPLSQPDPLGHLSS